MTTVKKMQNDVKSLVDKINSKHNHSKPELISFMKIVEEVGEITQVLLKNQINSRKSAKLSKNEVKDELGNEISDCIISLLALANDFDIDISTFIVDKLNIHCERNSN